MKVTFRNGDLHEAERALARLSGLELEKPFMILIARNHRVLRRALERHISGVRFPTREQLEDPSSNFYRFAVERTKLERQFRGDVIGYGKALDELYDKFPDVFEARCEHKLAVDYLNDEEVSVELQEIPFGQIPQQGRAVDYSPLMDLITGLDKEKADG